jgi:beta-lactamase regulating signal transducer with metallopeptidase domain
MTIVEMSLSASVPIVAIVMIRALALHKLPKKTFLVLWGVVICRLLVPFSVPSRFSIYTGVDYLKKRFAHDSVTFIPVGVADSPQLNPLYGGVGQVMKVVMPAVASRSWLELLWLGVMGAFALFFIVAYIRCGREFRMSLPVEHEFVSRWLQKHSLRRPVAIRMNECIKAPLTYGIIRPVILFPKKTNWTDETQLQYVLAHEFTHIRKFDALKKLVLTAALCVHWFNPLVWVMVVLANRDMELACDEAVVRSFGETTKSAYALTLIGLEEKKGRLFPLATHFSKNAIEERIVSIMKSKKTSLAGMLLALALVAGTTTVFATSAAADNPLKPQQSPVNLPNQSLNTEGASYSQSTLSSYVNKTDGKTYYSWDKGVTWTPLTDAEFKAKYPVADVVWWTYEDYKQWLDKEKIALQAVIGEKMYDEKEGWHVFTQEKYNETLALYESILADLKKGIQHSKTVDGADNVSLSITQQDKQFKETAQSFGLYVALNNGKEVSFGPYETKEELLAVVKPYCKE